MREPWRRTLVEVYDTPELLFGPQCSHMPSISLNLYDVNLSAVYDVNSSVNTWAAARIWKQHRGQTQPTLSRRVGLLAEAPEVAYRAGPRGNVGSEEARIC